MDWIDKLDELKARLGVSSDAALARVLEVTPQYLSDVRRGGKPPSPLLKFKVLDKLAYSWTEDTVLDLLPDELRIMVKQKLRSVQSSGRAERAEADATKSEKRRDGAKQDKAK